MPMRADLFGGFFLTVKKKYHCFACDLQLKIYLLLLEKNRGLI